MTITKADGGGFLIGRGVLTWDAPERRSDRYGTVWLLGEDYDRDDEAPFQSMIEVGNVAALNEMRGRLVARVLKSRASSHIGDLFHGVFPRQPLVGDRIVLGEDGVFFHESMRQEGIGVMVGLRPRDGRQTLWLDLRGLYDAHEQTVELIFEPGAPQ